MAQISRNNERLYETERVEDDRDKRIREMCEKIEMLETELNEKKKYSPRKEVEKPMNNIVRADSIILNESQQNNKKNQEEESDIPSPKKQIKEEDKVENFSPPSSARKEEKKSEKNELPAPFIRRNTTFQSPMVDIVENSTYVSKDAGNKADPQKNKDSEPNVHEVPDSTYIKKGTKKTFSPMLNEKIVESPEENEKSNKNSIAKEHKIVAPTGAIVTSM